MQAPAAPDAKARARFIYLGTLDSVAYTPEDTKELTFETDHERITIIARKKWEWARVMGRDAYGLYEDVTIKGVAQRFRYIPPGRFLMGSPDDEAERDAEDETQHEVVLTTGFWLADTACTQALWEAVMGSNPSEFKGKQNPVDTVSWDDCQEFLGKINGLAPGLDVRLSTEAEWEYACRVGTTTPFSLSCSSRRFLDQQRQECSLRLPLRVQSRLSLRRCRRSSCPRSKKGRQLKGVVSRYSPTCEASGLWRRGECGAPIGGIRGVGSEMLCHAFAGKGFVGMEIFLRGLLDNVGWKGWRRRLLVPMNTFKIIADELFVIGGLGPSRRVAFHRPKARGVGCEDFVNQDYVVFFRHTPFKLGVADDDAPRPGIFTCLEVNLHTLFF